MAALLSNALFASALILVLVSNVHAHSNTESWRDAQATYYGNPDGSGTSGGACGFDEKKEAFGPFTVAVSPPLFKGAAGCGSCYEVRCDSKGTKWCKPGNKTALVTATNLCPDTSKEHFDLSQPAFHEIAEHEGGIVPIQYRRVPCKRSGGVRVKIEGNPDFNMISFSNVGGPGDVASVEVRAGKKLPWTKLRRNWGVKWQADVKIAKRKLSFRITSTDGKSLTLLRVTQKHWKYGQTFETKKNF